MADASPSVTVLLVDDQALIGAAVGRMLAREADVRFVHVSDPLRAVETAKELRPTVILSDLVMPQMDGFELVRRFRKEEATRRIPLIVLSSKEDAATKAEAFRLGANDYIVKLPDRLEMVARLRHHSAGYVGQLERDAAYEALRKSQEVLQDDIDQAARYVTSLLPAPVEAPLRAKSLFVPSASLGGDALGYHWLDDDHFVAFLLDVSGHGVGAALLSVSVLNTLRSGSLPGTEFRDPGAVLTALGDAFTMESHGGKFFTIWYGVYRPSTRELSWAGGGHPPGLLYEPGAAAPRELECQGPMPGLVRLDYVSARAVVPAGSRLLLYSDGVYEIRKADGDAHGLPDFLRDMAGAAAQPLDRAIARAEALSEGRPYADDVTLLEVAFP